MNVGVFSCRRIEPDVSVAAFALWPLQSRLFEPMAAADLRVHARPWLHIFFNMFGLFMFGSEVEQLFGAKRYLIYYLSCVVGAALMHLIVIYFANLPMGATVGASGAVFGLLLAFGMAYPRQQLIIFPIPVPIQAWLAVTLYGLMELFLGVTGTAQGIAHFAHLGGMATGFVLIRYWQSQRRRPPPPRR